MVKEPKGKSSSSEEFDRERLIYFEVREKLQADMEAWSQRRFWWLVIPSTLVGVIGLSSLAFATIYSIFKDEISQAQKATAKAQLATEHADKSSADISADFKKLNVTMVELSKTAQNISSEFSNMKSRIESESDNARASADTKIGALESRVNELSKFAQDIATAPDRMNELIAEFKATVAEQKKQSDEKIGQFEENSKYWVKVCTVSEKPADETLSAIQASQILKDAGYKSNANCWANLSVYFPRGMESNAFYVSGNKETEVAIPKVIDTLKKTFPSFRFITASPSTERPIEFFSRRLDSNEIYIGLKYERG